MAFFIYVVIPAGLIAGIIIGLSYVRESNKEDKGLTADIARKASEANKNAGLRTYNKQLYNRVEDCIRKAMAKGESQASLVILPGEIKPFTDEQILQLRDKVMDYLNKRGFHCRFHQAADCYEFSISW